MDNLIKKAVEAVKEDKKEYAIGLLEGVLEMIKPNPSSYSLPISLTEVNTSVSTPTGPKDEEAEILDGVAAARLAEVKRMSEESSK